jgi:hypothetical protein
MLITRRRRVEVGVPTVHRFGPYGFYFWSQENRATGEPPHIHVRSASGEAIFWLSPVSLRQASREIERIRRLVVSHRQVLMSHWNDFFDQ